VRSHPHARGDHNVRIRIARLCADSQLGTSPAPGVGIAGGIYCGDLEVADDHEAERIGNLRAAITAYLQRCPHAGDTPEGIVASWLPQRGYEDALQWIGEVIDIMVSAGELKPRPLPDGRVLYVRGPALVPDSGSASSK
jgi:hypothetical protein